MLMVYTEMLLAKTLALINMVFMLLLVELMVSNMAFMVGLQAMAAQSMAFTVKLLVAEVLSGLAILLVMFMLLIIFSLEIIMPARHQRLIAIIMLNGVA